MHPDAHKSAVRSALQVLSKVQQDAQDLRRQYERVHSQRQHVQQQVQSVSQNLDQKFGSLTQACVLMQQAAQTKERLKRVSAEGPDRVLAAQRLQLEQQRELDALRHKHMSLTEAKRQVNQQAADEARDQCVRELEQKQNLLSNVQHKMHQTLNLKTELQETMKQKEDELWARLKEQLDQLSDDMSREYFEQQGRKNLEKKRLKEQTKELRNQLAEELKQVKKEIEYQNMAIAQLQKRLSNQPAHKRLTTHSPAASRTDSYAVSPGQRSDRSLSRHRSHDRHVTFAEQPDRRTHEDEGAGDVRRRLNTSVSLTFSDDDDY